MGMGVCSTARMDSRNGFSWLGLSMLAGAVLAVLDLSLQAQAGALNTDVAWIGASLWMVMGVVVGLMIELQERLVRALEQQTPRPALAAGVRALGVLALSVPLAATLFEGSFAQTLPGASTAALWLPILSWLCAAAALLLVQRTYEQTAEKVGWRIGLGVACGLAALGLYFVNRSFKRDELLDAHTGMLFVVLVGVALALGFAVKRRKAPLSQSFAASAAVLVVLNFVLATTAGLRSPESREMAVTPGSSTHLQVRLVRSFFDLDNDGYSPVLGGVDCDDRDAKTHPEAREIPGNAKDEDCDGVVLAEAPTLALAPPVPPPRAADASPATSGLEATGLDLVIVSVDALRGDALWDTPEARERYPNFFNLLDESVVFDHGFAPAAGTDLSMSTLMTGQLDPFRAIDMTMLESLAPAFDHKIAVVPGEVLRYAGRTLLSRGVDELHEIKGDTRQRDIGNRATSQSIAKTGLESLAARPQDERVLTWVHFFDAHEHDELDPGQIGIIPNSKVSADERYATAVGLVDEGVGTLIEGLKAQGRWDRSVIVFVSDHGEGLNQSPRLPSHHGLYLYNELTHVPVAIRVPGAAPSHRETAVSLIDVMPTLTTLFSVQRPEGVAGRDLSPLLASAETDGQEIWLRPLLLTESEQRGVIVWPYKLLKRPEDNLIELYDLTADFEERNNLAPNDPVRAAELSAVMQSLPHVVLDRTKKGRKRRELLAKRPADAAVPAATVGEATTARPPATPTTAQVVVPTPMP